MSTPFGNLIRNYRVAAKISLRRAADALEVSHVYWSEVERGRRGPFARARLHRLSVVLSIPMDLLLDRWAEARIVESPAFKDGYLAGMRAQQRGKADFHKPL